MLGEFSERIQSKAIVLNYPAVANCIARLGGSETNPRKLVAELSRERQGIRRVIRQIHIITDAAGLPPNIRDEFVRAGANIHTAHGDRTECLTYFHAERMADIFDVVALIVDDSGYLPLIRRMKALGTSVELHAMPSADPALFPAADEVVGLYPPGAPLPLRAERSKAA